MDSLPFFLFRLFCVFRGYAWPVGPRNTQKTRNKRINETESKNSERLLDCRDFLDRVVLDQARDCFGRLSTDADPVLDAVVFKLDCCRIDHRIVSPEILEVLAIALRTLFFYYEAIKGLTFRTYSHQA